MKRKTLMVCVMLMAILFATTVVARNALTPAGMMERPASYYESLFCRVGHDCELNSLSVGNLTIYGTFVNVSVTDYKVTGDINATGSVSANYFIGNGSQLTGINSNTEDGTTNGQMLFWDTDEYKHTETSELFWDDVNKRVGIGTDSPGSDLEIYRTVGVPKIRIRANSSDYAGIDFLTKDGNFGQFESYKGSFNFNAKNELRFLVNDGTRAITIKTTGNVGIGTDSPVNKLDVSGGVSIGSSYAGTNTAPTDGLIVEGNVGIGTDSPQEKLDVNGNQIISGLLQVKTNILIGEEGGQFDFYNTDGDLYLDNGSQGIYNGQLGIWSLPYGAPLIVNENNADLVFSSLGGTATLNGTTQIICDSTNPFTLANEDHFLEVLNGTPNFTGATGEIKNYINSTCIEVSFGSAGSDIIPDGTGLSYIVYPRPVLAAFDNGVIHSNIGENPDAYFRIHIKNGTGFTGVYIDDVAGADQHQALTIDVDSKDHEGVVGLNVVMSSSTGASDVLSNTISLEGDAAGFNNSLLHFIDISLLGEGVNNDIDVISIEGLSSDTGHIIHAGNPDDISKTYYDNTVTTVDTTASFTSNTNNTPFFENDNSIIYIGNTLNFTTIGFSLETESSGGLNLEYYYCNDADNWVALTGVIDTTDGMQTSGTISFVNPSDRGKCNDEIDGTPFTNTTDFSYIAIKRTKNNVVTPPTESLITIAGGGDLFLLATDYMKLNPVDTEPEICDASMLGAIYFDISEDSMCQCKSTGWKVIEDGTDCT